MLKSRVASSFMVPENEEEVGTISSLHCAPEKYKIAVSNGSLGPWHSCTTYEKDSCEDCNAVLTWRKIHLSVGANLTSEVLMP